MISPLKNILASRPRFFFLIIFILLAILYGPLIARDPLLERDDDTLILPLQKISSLGQYIQGLERKEILDFQPVRDLSYMLDLWFFRSSGKSIHHFTNFICYLLLLILSYQFFQLLWPDSFPRNSHAVLVATALLAFHPVMVGSVGWISGRKHLLAAVFILLTSNLYLKEKRKGRAISIPVFYTLSVLSQPIHLLWPLWALAHHFLVKKRPHYLKSIIACLFVLPIVLGINISLYAPKAICTLGESISGKLALIVLAFGRAMAQILLPFSYATSYYEGSYLGPAGLYLGIGLFSLSYYRSEKSEFFSKIIYLLCSLALVLQYFIYDTYLIIPTVLLTGMALHAWMKFLPHSPRAINMALLTLVLSYFYIKSHQNALMWRSSDDLWKISYSNEPSPYNILHYAQSRVDRDPEEAFLLVTSIIERYSWWSPAIPTLLAKSIYLNPHLQLPEKERLFAQYHFDDRWYRYFHALTYLREGHLAEGLQLIADDLKSFAKYGDQVDVVRKDLQYFCRGHTENPQCEVLIPTREVKK